MRAKKSDLSSWEKLLGRDFKKRVQDYLISEGVLEEGGVITFSDPSIRHKGSDARYLFEGMINDVWVFVSVILPHSKTTTHFHEAPLHEKYHLEEGAASLSLDGKAVEMNKENNTVIVKPRVVHQVRTDKDFAFFVLTLLGASAVPRDKLHVYVKR